MPPLAQKLTREANLPISRRTFRTDYGALPNVVATPCFEITDVYDLVFQLASDIKKIADGPLTTFLPAPRVWIEWKLNQSRYGMLIEQDPGSDIVDIVEYMDLPGQNWLGTMSTSTVRLSGEGSGLISQDGEVLKSGWHDGGFGPQNLLPSILLIINSPKIIERDVVAPHRGLERDLRVALDKDAKFKLLPWSKIKLSLSARPASVRDGDRIERFTGAKALHFCRSHLRVRLGRLEIVSAHWRGDAALGIRQSSYVVAKGGRVGSAP